jgi:hypothetical protein
LPATNLGEFQKLLERIALVHPAFTLWAILWDAIIEGWLLFWLGYIQSPEMTYPRDDV